MIKIEKMNLKGKISGVQILPEGDTSLPCCGPDLVKMGNMALSYLIRNPDPSHNYECRFSFPLLNCPPFVPMIAPTQDLPDPIAIGDTESRNDIAFNLMREMTNSQIGREVQDAVHRRLIGYLRTGDGSVGDDLCWTVPYCMCISDDGSYGGFHYSCDGKYGGAYAMPSDQLCIFAETIYLRPIWKDGILREFRMYCRKNNSKS